MKTKFNDKQLMALKAAGFSAEEILLFQHNPSYAPSEEELIAIAATKNINEAINALPEDISALLDKIEKTYGILFKEKLTKAELTNKINLLAKQDPDLAKQTTILYTLLDHILE